VNFDKKNVDGTAFVIILISRFLDTCFAVYVNLIVVLTFLAKRSVISRPAICSYILVHVRCSRSFSSGMCTPGIVSTRKD